MRYGVLNKMEKEKCTYCHRTLTPKHSFSYGMPGIKRVFACDRLSCKILRGIKSNKVSCGIKNRWYNFRILLAKIIMPE